MTGPGLKFRGPAHEAQSFFSASEKTRIKKGQIQLDINIRAEEDAILNRVYYERLEQGVYPRAEASEDGPSRRERVVRAILGWYVGTPSVPKADLPAGDEDPAL